jgi:hypothetical protein
MRQWSRIEQNYIMAALLQLDRGSNAINSRANDNDFH